MWKWNNFPVTYIFRDINFGKLRVSKMTILTFLEPQNVESLLKLHKFCLLVLDLLLNRTNNFDVILHVTQAYPKEGLCKVSSHITHKQKSFKNNRPPKAATEGESS